MPEALTTGTGLSSVFPSGLWVTLALVATRIAAMLAVAPLFGPRVATWRIKLALALALTLLVAPSHWASAAPADESQTLAWWCHEAAIGLGLGLAVLMVAAGVQMAGQLISDAIGYQRSWLQGESTDPSSRMLELTAFALLLASGGHRVAIDALLATFETMPLGNTSWAGFEPILGSARHSFSFALSVAAPVVAATLAARLLLAILHRVQPSLRHAAIEPSATILAGVGMWLLCLGTVGLLAMDQLHVILGEVQKIFLASGV